MSATSTIRTPPRHLVFDSSDTYPVAILVKHTAFHRDEIRQHYLHAFSGEGIEPEIEPGDVIAFELRYNRAGKAPSTLVHEELETILAALDGLGTEFIYCCDAAYFKVLTKERKAEPNLGYVFDCQMEGYEHFKVILGVNHRSLIYNPVNEGKLLLANRTLLDAVAGRENLFGQSLLAHAEYPKGIPDIRAALDRARKRPELACDIETFGLRLDDAGIATIAFAWSDAAGVAFACDYKALAEPYGGRHGERRTNRAIRRLLREFFSNYRGKLLFHNATFDVRILIWELFMAHPHDTAGLLEGLRVLTRDFEDTKVMAYLALNSTSDVDLSLKGLAHEYAGNYAKDDIKNIESIPLGELLEYNLVDTACTIWVRNRHLPTVHADRQFALYRDLMLPSQRTIIEMELIGMPLDPRRVQNVKGELEHIRATHRRAMLGHDAVIRTELIHTVRAWEKDFRDRRDKAKKPWKIRPKTWSLFEPVLFNPQSTHHLQTLLYEVLELPVLERTRTGLAATGADVIEKLHHHTRDAAVIELLESLVGYTRADKILGTFIAAFERAIDKGDPDVLWLHGSFNLGGTVSGRLSSSDPNLQNLPSGSTYGKLVKSCFKAPAGWLFCGADFNSLEDYVSALTTRDPNKMAVYEKGYDGHCLRTYAYFGDQMPDIVDTVDSINSIKEKYPELRQESKMPTFALTYMGTHRTLMKNGGFSENQAKMIEAEYHELYKVSDAWVQERLKTCVSDGHVDVAFGLRVRTPILAKSLRGHSLTPREAEAEARTAGNALGQSYGLLNNRAMVAFMKEVWEGPYRHQVLPVSMIHDAGYFLVAEDLAVVEWVNRRLIHAMSWQELPELQHDTVKLGAALDIFYPSWADPITLPNGATQEEIKHLVNRTLASRG